MKANEKFSKWDEKFFLDGFTVAAASLRLEMEEPALECCSFGLSAVGEGFFCRFN